MCAPIRGALGSQARRKPLVPEAVGSERGRRKRPLSTRAGRSPGSSMAACTRQARARTRSAAPLPIAACHSQKRRATSLRSGEPVSARVHSSNHSCGDSPRLVRIRAEAWRGRAQNFEKEGRGPSQASTTTLQGGVTGVPFSSRPVGAGARTRSVCERTDFNVGVRVDKPNVLHEILSWGGETQVAHEPVTAFGGAAQDRRPVRRRWKQKPCCPWRRDDRLVRPCPAARALRPAARAPPPRRAVPPRPRS